MLHSEQNTVHTLFIQTRTCLSLSGWAVVRLPVQQEDRARGACVKVLNHSTLQDLQLELIQEHVLPAGTMPR